MQPLGFANWFGSLDLRDFKSNVLGMRSLFVPPRPEMADRISAALKVESVDDAFALSAAKVYAWFQKLDGRHTAAIVSRASARKLYDAGTTIYFRRIRELRPHEREVADALGIPHIGAECSLFCNQPEAKTRAHFDRADIVVIQLKGRKTWRIAPNAFAPVPLERWTTLDPVWPRVRRYAHDVPPTKMPDGAISYELERGSVLHIPRGYWHETFSDQSSLSLHIEIAAPSRLDFMIAALKNELAREEWWREPAYDLSAGDGSAIERAAVARVRLREAVSRLDPQDLVHPAVRERPSGPATRFVRCGQVSFALEGVDPRQDIAHVTITSHEFRETKITHMEMSLAFIGACKWLNALATGAAFDIQDILRAAPGLDDAEVQELLSLLEETRLVRRVGNTSSRAPA